jgi:hypothetical protein
MTVFFNTIHATSAEVDVHKLSTARQDDIILAFFRANPTKSFTPPEVHDALFGPNTPDDSVKRSLNTLTNCKEQYLIKLPKEYMRKGRYNKLNHCWCLRKEVKQVKLFEV